MLVRFSVFNTLPTFGIIKRILFLEHLYEKIISDTESCLVENLAYRFFVPNQSLDASRPFPIRK